MAGNIKVGGNTIFTHTGAVGAGTVTLKDQNGNAILTDDGTAVSMGNLRLPTTGGIKDSSGNNILTESGGNVSVGNVRLPTTGGIKDSSGNDILTESGGNVSVGDVRLPTTGGIKDSAGNNALTESSGTVTINAAEGTFEKIYNAHLYNTGGDGIFDRVNYQSSDWHYINSVDTGTNSYSANTNVTIVPEGALETGGYWGYIWFTQGTGWPGDRSATAMCNFSILNTWGSTFHSFVPLPTGSRLAGSGNIEIRAFGTTTNIKNGIHARLTGAVGAGSGTNVYCNIRVMRML